MVQRCYLEPNASYGFDIDLCWNYAQTEGKLIEIKFI